MVEIAVDGAVAIVQIDLLLLFEPRPDEEHGVVDGLIGVSPQWKMPVARTEAAKRHNAMTDHCAVAGRVAHRKTQEGQIDTGDSQREGLIPDGVDSIPDWLSLILEDVMLDAKHFDFHI